MTPVKSEDSVIEVTEENFLETVIYSDIPVLVDCYSPLCLPCLSQGEILGKLAGEYKNIKFCKLNTDSNPDLSDKLKVKSVPTLLFFSKHRNKIEAHVGLRSKQKLKSKIEEMLI